MENGIGELVDFIVLLSCSAGFVGGAFTVLETILGAPPGYEKVSEGFRAFTSIRLIKLMRALQLSRWIYSHPQMRGLLETVFRSWQAMILVGVFSMFSMLTIVSKKKRQFNSKFI